MADTLKTKTVAIGTSSTELLVAVTSGVTVITNLMINNIDGSAAATFNLSINQNGAGDTTIASTVSVGAGKMMPIFNDQNGKLYLMDSGTADTLDALASAAGDLIAVISYIERT